MANSAHFYAGASGRRYLYAKDADVECPYAAELARDSDQPNLGELTGLVWAHAEDRPEWTPPNVEKLVRSAHKIGARVRDADRPTECAQCGAELAVRGYRTWVEARLNDPLLDGKISETTRKLNERLGADWMIVPGSVRWWDKKREAMAWAREEAAIDKAAAREEATT